MITLIKKPDDYSRVRGLNNKPKKICKLKIIFMFIYNWLINNIYKKRKNKDMAITMITTPAQYGRVADSNRLYYKFSSDNYTESNFQYQFNMRVYDVAGNYTDLGTYNIHAAPAGDVEFNPSAIYANYLSYDLDISKTGLTEMTQTALKFQLFVNEYYGTPPVKVVAGGWYESTPLNVYNAAQQNIPYDYTPLNVKGNLKWVMSNVSGATGQYLTDATEFRMDNKDFGYLYALGGLTTGRPNKVRYTIAYMPGPTTGTTTNTLYLIGTYRSGTTITLVSGTTYTITSGFIEVWEDDTTYTGQLTSPFTFSPIAGTAKLVFQNVWLSYQVPYSTQFNISKVNKDLPSYEQSMPNASDKVMAQTTPYTLTDMFVDGNGLTHKLPRGGFYALSIGYDYWIAVLPDLITIYSDVRRIGDGDPLPTLVSPYVLQYPNIYSVTGDYIPDPTGPPIVQVYDTDIHFNYNNSLGYYVPCGPYNAIQSGVLTGYEDNWLYYDVDLILSSGVSGDTVLNTYPVRFINTCHDSKYERWELLWFNPHGGFDAHTFTQKLEMNYKIDKSTYKQKTAPTFSPYTAGEKVFNVNVEEIFTLRSALLTQKESQLLIQMIQSPVVYAIKYYEYNNVKTYFVVPYIITSNQIKYEQKKNDKEIYMEITLRASNTKTIQKN